MSNEPPDAWKPPSASLPAFEALVAAQRGPLVRYAARLLSDPVRAQDVVQDTFIKFFAQPGAALAGREVEWLFTVCRNGARDVLRKEGRMTQLDPAAADRLDNGQPVPARALEAAELAGLVRTLIGRLPPSQQEVIRLKFQNGFSYKEIARITERSVNHVGVLIHTAVSRLRAEWEAQESAAAAGPAPAGASLKEHSP